MGAENVAAYTAYLRGASGALGPVAENCLPCVPSAARKQRHRGHFWVCVAACARRKEIGAGNLAETVEHGKPYLHALSGIPLPSALHAPPQSDLYEYQWHPGVTSSQECFLRPRFRLGRYLNRFLRGFLSVTMPYQLLANLRDSLDT